MPSENDAKIRELVAHDIAEKQAFVDAVKQQIRELQDGLLTTEAKLEALRKFANAYDAIGAEVIDALRKIEAPPLPVEMTATPSLDTFVPQIPPFLQPHQVLSDERLTPTPYIPTPPAPFGRTIAEQIEAPPLANSEPRLPPAKLTPKAFAEQRATAVVADVVQVEQWAAQRGVQFNGWDDLPGVNKKRKELGVAPFVQRNIAVPARVK